MSNTQETEQWHLDKRVPLALIWTIMAQTVALIVAGTILWSQVQSQARDLSRVELQITRDVQRLDRQIGEITAAANNQAIQLGRMEENLSAIRSDIRRLVTIWEGPNPRGNGR